MSSEARTRRLPRPLRHAAQCARERLGRSDNALAITLVEAYLRPPLWRAIEYVYWGLCHMCGSSKNRRLTLGTSQVRSEYLLEYLEREGRKPTFWQIVRTGEHFGSAADVAATFLAARTYSGLISCEYTGCHNPYYESLVRDVTAVLVRDTLAGDRVAYDR